MWMGTTHFSHLQLQYWTSRAMVCSNLLGVSGQESREAEGEAPGLDPCQKAGAGSNQARNSGPDLLSQRREQLSCAPRRRSRLLLHRVGRSQRSFSATPARGALPALLGWATELRREAGRDQGARNVHRYMLQTSFSICSTCSMPSLCSGRIYFHITQTQIIF